MNEATFFPALGRDKKRIETGCTVFAAICLADFNGTRAETRVTQLAVSLSFFLLLLRTRGTLLSFFYSQVLMGLCSSSIRRSVVSLVFVHTTHHS